MSLPLPNYIGKTFTRVTVIGIERQGRRSVYVCHCECGATVKALGHDLRRGKVKSCGCLRNDRQRAHPSRLIHGGARTCGRSGEYQSWTRMVQRCEDSASKSYPDYGGRGISICSRWRQGDGIKSGFECFLEDMGPRPAGMSIDRIDNDGNYEPRNCRWATTQEQNLNTRANRIITINGERLPFTEAHRRFGKVSIHCAWARVGRGWDPAAAIVTPSRECAA